MPSAYALRLQGDANAPEYYYVGSTSDIQTRIAQHTTAIPGGAKWTALHPPVAVLDVVPCATAFQAACVECALWGLYTGKCKDYDRVRGAKFCMLDPLRYPPSVWKNERPTVESVKRPLGDVYKRQPFDGATMDHWVEAFQGTRYSVVAFS